MYRNYVKIALRNITTSKLYSLMNIAGLGIGIACFLLITMFVLDELSYDKYHSNYQHIYRVLHSNQNSRTAKSATHSPEDSRVWGNATVGPALKSDLPEIRSFFRFTSAWAFLFENNGQKTRVEHMVYADSAAFDIFSWKLLKGNPKTCLTSPNSIVLTQSTAEQLFGNEDPVGKTIKKIQAREEAKIFMVTGVMEDVPANSHFTFDGLVSMLTLYELAPHIFANWYYNDFYTYLLVNESSDFASMSSKVPSFLKKYVPDDADYSIAFEPISDAYFHSKAARQPGSMGSLWTVYIFFSIGVFILFIACINFINLTTARSIERAKEVGVRKTVGAQRYHLIVQFLSESMFMAVLASITAIGLVAMMLPVMREISAKPLYFELLVSWKYVSILMVVTLLIGLLAGSYPALVLAQFRPHTVLKGTFKSSMGGLLMRKVLITLQFSLSIVLLVGTMVVFNQLDYLQGYDLGFDQEQVIIVDYDWDETVHQRLSAIKTELLKREDVVAVSSSYSVPNSFFLNGNVELENYHGEVDSKSLVMYPVDADFIGTYKMEMVAGRDFSERFSQDSVSALILNEQAASAFGYTNPEDVIGKKFRHQQRVGQVIGVVKNFNYRSLHSTIEPLGLWIPPVDYMHKLSIRLKSMKVSESIDEIAQLWNGLVPKRPFLFNFLDETFSRQYEADRRFGKVFNIFTGLAIFITCLGLFGLTTYSVNQRTKEVGIRKVLGASLSSIVLLLSWDIYKLLGVSILLAVPLSWYAMNQWLENFAYHINIRWWVFALTGIGAISIAFLTVSFQSVKAATSNPIKALRNE